jgi:hypothetical protein
MSPNRPLKALLCSFFLALAFSVLTSAQAQDVVTPSRITQAINESNLTVLHGNTHPLAQARFDQGAVADSLPMNRMLLVLKRSQAQETALNSLLDQQQDPTSPNYHQWLTPQQFGQQFGPSDQDVQTITNWLQSHGFTINGVSNGRTVIEFSGTAGQVRDAFHTEIHHYTVNGADHFANSSDPQIPSALTPVVAGIESLNDFPRHAMYHAAGVMTRSSVKSATQPLYPLFTLGGECGVPGVGCYGVGPYDFATIYDVLPLWNASSPIDGTGQTIAIIGETDINLQDVQSFRSYFGLPPNNPTVIVNGPDPGIIADEETESDLDVEWAGAVAKGATIDFVVSQTTSTTSGVDLSAQYVIDNNLAPILSESYGECELFLGQTGNSFFEGLWQQAAAQGITVLLASGDSGSAVCDRETSSPPDPATHGLAVSGLSSTPYNVAVGGTDFNDLTDPSNYWSTTNTAPPGNAGAPATISALSYIPETTWNNSCTNGVFGTLLGFSTNPTINCNNSQLLNFVAANGGSGGQSNCSAPTGTAPTDCTGGYQKPTWQSAPGVPSDGKRDVPDVSLFAAVNSPSGAFYVICEADKITSGTSCSTSGSTNFYGVGGTSASTPAFAGIMALVDQETDTRQGNANYVLYKLASQHSAGIHDTPAGGTIAMPCAPGSPNCTAPAGDTYGILSGYSTTSGYDLATGLGSVDAGKLVTAWASANTNLNPSTTTLVLDGGASVDITHGQTVTVNITVSGNNGTPTGSVLLVANTPSGAQTVTTAPLVGGSASFTTDALPGGSSYTVFARYPGDGAFHSSDSGAQAITVSPEPSKVQLAYDLLDSSGNVTSSNVSTASFGTPALLRVNVTSQAGDACPNNAPGDTGCPTGTVSLADNGAPLGPGTYTLNSLGYAQDDPALLTVGQHSLTASYPGDASFNPSSSQADVVTITQASTTVALNGPSSANTGSPTSIIAVVTTQVPASSSSIYPTGSVQFLLGSVPIQLGSGGALPSVSYTTSTSPAGTVRLTALLNIASLPPGVNSIAAQYLGDSNFSASPVSAAQQIDVQTVTSTSISSSSPSIQHGASVTFTATITQAVQVAPAPTGTVQFTLYTPAGQSIGSVPLVNGTAQVTDASLGAGTYTVYATYSGDSDNLSSFASTQQTVIGLASVTVLTSSSPNATAGSNITFTAQVSPAVQGGPTPTGSVTFGIPGESFANSELSNGQAQTARGFSTGTYTIEAQYFGDSNYNASSTSITETVNAIGTTTTITASTQTVNQGSPITFTATVTPAITNGPALSGTVQFMANSAVIGSSELPASGQVQLTTSSLAPGTYQIQADFENSFYFANSSASTTVTVTAPSFSVTANPSSVSITQPGQSASTTLTFTSQNGLTGTGGFSSSTCGTSASEEITCSLTSFTLPANGTATATLTFSSTAASGVAPSSRKQPTAPVSNAPRTTLLILICALVALAFAQRRKEHRWQFALAAVLFAVMFASVSCGGGSGGSGGGGGPTNPGTPTGAVQPLSVSVTINGATQTVPGLTLTVQ